MKKIILLVLSLILLVGCSKINEASLIGSYQDINSHSATMSISKGANGLDIVVEWYMEPSKESIWYMTGKIDGNKIVYSDCKKITRVLIDDFEYSTVEYTSKSGSFSFKNDKLFWIGAYDLECSNCKFEKIKGANND